MIALFRFACLHRIHKSICSRLFLIVFMNLILKSDHAKVTSQSSSCCSKISREWWLKKRKAHEEIKDEKSRLMVDAENLWAENEQLKCEV
jgi:hypothetical protein